MTENISYTKLIWESIRCELRNSDNLVYDTAFYNELKS